MPVQMQSPSSPMATERGDQMKRELERHWLRAAFRSTECRLKAALEDSEQRLDATDATVMRRVTQAAARCEELEPLKLKLQHSQEKVRGSKIAALSCFSAASQPLLRWRCWSKRPGTSRAS